MSLLDDSQWSDEEIEKALTHANEVCSGGVAWSRKFLSCLPAVGQVDVIDDIPADRLVRFNSELRSDIDGNEFRHLPIEDIVKHHLRKLLRTDATREVGWYKVQHWQYDVKTLGYWDGHGWTLRGLREGLQDDRLQFIGERIDLS